MLISPDIMCCDAIATVLPRNRQKALGMRVSHPYGVASTWVLHQCGGAEEGLGYRGGAKRRVGAPESPGPQRAMGRIEHTLLDEGRASSPTDLRPSPATPPYHKK